MRLKFWVSRIGPIVAAVCALALVAGVHVRTQAPFVVFGSNSGTPQPIKSTGNALWASIQGGTVTAPLKLPDGSASTPSLTGVNYTTTGLFFTAQGFESTVGGNPVQRLTSTGFLSIAGSGPGIGFGATHASSDTQLVRDGAANTLALRNGASAQVFRIGPSTAYLSLTSANLVTAGTDSTLVDSGTVGEARAQYSITPATAGTTNCGTAFAAAALTADCVVATLKAGQKLIGFYADVTVGLTCSGTCSGTKVVQCGISAGTAEILAASRNVAATATYGLADADMGSGMTRAAMIQSGYVPSWSATSPVSCRFTSGTGNWGNGAATFVNAGAVTFTLVTQQVK